MKVLIDTCVIIDVLQSREPFYENGQKIFLLLANNHFEGYITAKTATDIYYLTHRVTHSDSKTRKIMENLFILFNLLDTAASDCKQALISEMKDYEDAVMVETATRCGMDYIVTRNVKDYKEAGIKILEPFEFIKLFQNNED